MKKKFATIATVLAAFAAVAALPASASAGSTSYVSNCSLSAVLNGIGNGWWQGYSDLSCTFPTNATSEQCIQDYYSGAWHNYTCKTVGGYYSNIPIWINFYPYQYSSRYWRVWAWAKVSCGGGWCYATSISGSRYL